MRDKLLRTLVKAWMLPIDFVFLPLTFRLRRVLLLVGDSVPTLSVIDQSRPPKIRIASAVVGCSKPSIGCSKQEKYNWRYFSFNQRDLRSVNCCCRLRPRNIQHNPIYHILKAKQRANYIIYVAQQCVI